jgi:hypothetical protein
MLQKIKNQLESTFDRELLDKLFESHQLLTEHYYLGRHRPCAMEAGRFAEVAFRMLQQVLTGQYTPLGVHILNLTDDLRKFEQLERVKFKESLRIQIPRVIQVIYDIRNKRDIDHVGGDVDANLSDATLSLTSCNWVLTEFLRIYYTSDVQTAQRLVNSLVKVRIPLIQDFNGFLKILNPKLTLPDKILALLYYRGSDGATVSELNDWLSRKFTANHMSITLDRLEHDRALIYRNGDLCFITDTGRRFAEENIDFKI